MSKASFVSTPQGGNSLLLDNYLYRQYESSKDGARKYYRCRNKKCTAKAVVSNDYVISKSGSHDSSHMHDNNHTESKLIQDFSNYQPIINKSTQVSTQESNVWYNNQHGGKFSNINFTTQNQPNQYPQKAYFTSDEFNDSEFDVNHHHTDHSKYDENY